MFKLVRNFAGLQSLFYTLKQAYKELGLLIILVAVGILLYSNLVYFCEKTDINTSINCTGWQEALAPAQRANIGNHPCYSWTYMEAFWWGLMTMTTVGYDLYPKVIL